MSEDLKAGLMVIGFMVAMFFVSWCFLSLVSASTVSYRYIDLDGNAGISNDCAGSSMSCAKDDGRIKVKKYWRE